MTSTNKKLLYTILLTLLVTSSVFVRATEDPATDGVDQTQGGSDDMDTVTETPENKGLQPSDDADVAFLFTRPSVEKPYEFPIGKEVHYIIGFKNKGQKDFYLNNLDSSFRYSLDFNYILQNFTSYPFNRLVEPNGETTVGYSLYVSEQYAARAYGFTVNLLYSDKDGVQYQNTVFNETVTLIEIDDGLDSESFFLYLLLAGIVALIIYGLNKLYVKYVNPTKRSSIKPSAEQEKVSNTKEVDYDWLPPAMVANLKKTSTGSKKAAAN